MTLKLRGHIETGRSSSTTMDLPEGIEVRLTLVDDADDLDSEDRFRLYADLDQSQAEIDRGEGFPASEVIAGLRNRGR